MEKYSIGAKKVTGMEATDNKNKTQKKSYIFAQNPAPQKMEWDYRILVHEEKNGEVWFQIHHVYYSSLGDPIGYGIDATVVNTISADVEALKQIKFTIEEMLKATTKPVLYYGDRFPAEYLQLDIDTYTREECLQLDVEKYNKLMNLKWEKYKVKKNLSGDLYNCKYCDRKMIAKCICDEGIDKWNRAVEEVKEVLERRDRSDK